MRTNLQPEKRWESKSSNEKVVKAKRKPLRFDCVITHPCRVIVVSMYAEHRYGDVEILILIVYPGEPTGHVTKQSTCRKPTEKQQTPLQRKLTGWC